ncbi:MAG: DNA polymerase I [Mucinivorans sp.]
MEKLFLIDAYALIFRFYYAFITNPFRNSAGQNVSAVFGFVKFLNELIQTQHPAHLGVAFDPKGGNFRHQLFPDYKANRSATPEDIMLSVPIIKEILQAMKIPILEVAGYEADDVIGTISHKASLNGGFQTFMVTPDKDYGQLIRPNVSIYKPAKGGNGVEVVGLERICEVYGISDPLYIIDILALWGDVSDNIPGVPGIGEKGACKLVNRYGTIENIYDHLSDLPPRQRESIEAGWEQLKLSKLLATISLDVPIEFEPDRLIMESPDYNLLRDLYLKHGFRMFLHELEQSNLIISSLTTVAKPQPYSVLKAVQGSLFDVLETPLPVVQSISEPQNVTVPPFSEASELELGNIKTIAHNYIVADNEQEIKELVVVMGGKKCFCFDTETTSLDPLQCSLVGISFSCEAHTAYWVPISKATVAERLKLLRPLFENESIGKIGHNIKYDILVMRSSGIEVRGELLDTMILHYLLNAESRHSMDYVSRTVLSYDPVSIEELIGKGVKQLSMDRVASHLVSEYGAEDSDVTYQLYEVLWRKIVDGGLEKLYRTIEEPLIRILADMEFVGVKVDTDILGENAVELNAKLVDLERRIRLVAGDNVLNVNSPKQLGELLFEKLGLNDKAKLTKTKQYKTDEQTLSQMEGRHPVVAQILEYRGIKKLLSTYIEALPQLINPNTGRVHTSFNQAVTATGRLSSTNPNLQNIPVREAEGRAIRRAFVAGHPGWVLVAADYSQVELRIMAHLSGDKNMIEAFKHGEDIHTATAAKIYNITTEDVSREQRRRAKTANFGIIYGISAFGLAQRLDIPRGEAKELIDNYFSLYPDVKSYMDRVIEQAKGNGYVETIFSRRRYLADIASHNATVRSVAERNAINAPIQGSAADIMKLAMILVDKAMRASKLQARILLQVHDELLIEAPLAEVEQLREILSSEMARAACLSVPLEVEVGVGENWVEAH